MNINNRPIEFYPVLVTPEDVLRCVAVFFNAANFGLVRVKRHLIVLPVRAYDAKERTVHLRAFKVSTIDEVRMQPFPLQEMHKSIPSWATVQGQSM